MGITATVRLQYWQDGSERTPTSDRGLYPNGTDVLTTWTVDASRFDALVDGAKVIAHAAHAFASAAEGNALGLLFSGAQLTESVKDLRRALADRVGPAYAFSIVTFPHPRYNRVRVLFSADSNEDALSEVGHAPPATAHTPNIQYRADNSNRFHRRAEFWMELDGLRQSLGEDRFFFKKYPFAFSTRETDAIITDLSVLSNVDVVVFPQRETAPVATTDVIYFRRVPGQEIPAVVARQRLAEFIPRIGGMSEGRGEPVTVVPLGLSFDNGAFRVNGAPYDLVQLSFVMRSSRKVVAGRPPIEIEAGVHPDSAGRALLPSVVQPLPGPACQLIPGQPVMEEYLAEGVGSASLIFEPDKVPLGRQYTVVFSATQQPGGWQCSHHVQLNRIIVFQPFAGRGGSPPPHR